MCYMKVGGPTSFRCSYLKYRPVMPKSTPYKQYSYIKTRKRRQASGHLIGQKKRCLTSCVKSYIILLLVMSWYSSSHTPVGIQNQIPTSTQ
jgi:predicted anti-sigma-YlaC factor YlaD